MTTDITTPFDSILKQAAASPAKTGEVEKHRRRQQNAGSATVILADVSSSMDDSAGRRRKIDILRESLAAVLPGIPDWILISFSQLPTVLRSAQDLPAPSGGTALHLALDAAAAHHPRTLVISDGQPDSEQDALASTDRLPGRIDVIYCGPDNDHAAIAFMRRLARAGGGTVIIRDLRRSAALAPAMRQMFALLPGKDST